MKSVKIVAGTIVRAGEVLFAATLIILSMYLLGQGVVLVASQSEKGAYILSFSGIILIGWLVVSDRVPWSYLWWCSRQIFKRCD